ncbi:putative serine threonine-protein kinase ppk18 [Golovinomyces cichoracearum]|uniref:non-specific serine/threonine protein kinase n=1 Tax=Golovinomyces cichoracearum TaxID=62708 RepID=A0A420J385_9PEZI|nr:putative serine threonine-protein kinase ppk18 [Golovinomyces cichoracearum]
MSKPQLAIQAPPTLLGSQVGWSLNADIRVEREDLKEAAEQTLNVILDLGLDGVIRWVSPSWIDVIGTSQESVTGKPIKDLLTSDNKNVFSEAIDKMKKDNSRSHFIRFSVQLGPSSKLASSEYHGQAIVHDYDDMNPRNSPIICLEGQGILVTARASDFEGQHSETGETTHTMWMIRPWIAPREIQIDLPDVIIESLGSGAEVLASYLTSIAETNVEDPSSISPPPPVLCRICERHIPPWWFEKHTELCLQEHRLEMEVQLSQENLLEHRHSIVKILDAFEAGKSRPGNGDNSTHLSSLIEYKNMPIGFSASSSGNSASGITTGRSRETTNSANTYSRKNLFTIRRPLARIVELLLDLCDTSLEISTPAFKEISNSLGEFRVQSPQSEGRISQVIQWQSPCTNALDEEQGLALLCADTERVAKAKVEAVLRYRQIIEYSERIRIEFSVLVQECIDEAIRKSTGISTEYLSDSDEEVRTQETGVNTCCLSDPPHEFQTDPARDGETLLSPTTNSSTRSSSPKECPILRPQAGYHNMHSHNYDAHRHSLLFESDPGGDSDGSVRSLSLISRVTRTDSPVSEINDLRRAASTRQCQRRSIILPGSSSPRRQESPVRHTQPSSPLRINKPRSLAIAHEGFASPIVSPMHTASEFSSPALLPHHHRRQSSAAGSDPSRPPQSPRLSSVGVPQARAAQPSIKDFEVIKPISRGAFGSVYLAKKKSTGDYYAIKVLKKADMVAKNQVTNVKAERAIMMLQSESDLVAKLYWTFSSKEYLYLVMEYLNGGDCAALIKVLGGLPEDWAKKYLGEVILGVKHLHSRGIVHRDLKPDNLLIDQKGHLKLTDFGLSRMGLIGRQKRVLDGNTNDSTPDLFKQGPFARATSLSSSRSTSLDFQSNNSPCSSSQSTSEHSLIGTSYFNLNREGVSKRISRRASGRSDSGDTLHQIFSSFSLNDSDSQKSIKQRIPAETEQGEQEGFSNEHTLLHSINNQHACEQKNVPHAKNMMPPPMALFDPDDNNRRFVGTPDYLAPETVKGVGQDETSDWWSVGCILFEFLHGYPPFHAETPDKVFENILARRISWPDENECNVSIEARDLVNKLLCLDPKQRIGSNSNDKYECGADEIQAHPWFEGVAWDKLLEDDAQFVPAPENPEDTEYFDSRGATLQSFAEEMEDKTSPPNSAVASEYHERPHDALSRVRSQVNSMKRNMMPLHIPPHVRDMKSQRLSEPLIADDFGNFTFKNLPVLEKANKDVIQKLRAEAMAIQSKPANISPVSGLNTAISPGGTIECSPFLQNSVQKNITGAKVPPPRSSSPSGINQASASPNKASRPSSPMLVSFVVGQNAENRRTISSTSTSLTCNSASSSTHGNIFEGPRMTANIQKQISGVSSPIKSSPSTTLSPSAITSSPKTINSAQTGIYSNRSRSLTVDSQESNSSLPIEIFSARRNRRSQVFEISPSSSDTEGDRETALLRVQRRRQSSRRLSQICTIDHPSYRPLDVLICEDHPVTRMVMEKLLEKLLCRSITVSNGAEAVRFAMGEIQFDLIIMEFKLPQINGADVARMIRNTKNANSQTPIVALTGYLKELQAPHQFDALIEKPPTTSKLTDTMCRLCHWKSLGPNITNEIPRRHRKLSDLRVKTFSTNEGPTNGPIRSGLASEISSKGFQTETMNSRKIKSNFNSISNEKVPIIINRKATGDWEEASELGIRNEDSRCALDSPEDSVDNERNCCSPVNRQAHEKGNEEDNGFGYISTHEKNLEIISNIRRGSKLSNEMMRTNSQGSVISGSDLPSDTENFGYSRYRVNETTPISSLKATKLTPPQEYLGRDQDVEFDPGETPKNNSKNFDKPEGDPTPRALSRSSDHMDQNPYNQWN